MDQGETQTWRVDHVGSLLRPATLLSAIGRHAAGVITEADLEQAQNEAITAVIQAQERVGLPVVTDGEFRRIEFMESFADVAGWRAWGRADAEGRIVVDALAPPTQASGQTSMDPTIRRQHAVTEPLRLVSNKPLREYEFASKVATRRVKVTLINVDRIRSMIDVEHSIERYRQPQAFVEDLIRVEREIVGGMTDAGCQYVQIDGPAYTRFVDPVWREYMRTSGQDALAALRESVEIDNRVVDGHEGVTFGIHLCRGNPADGGYHRQGSYDDIAEILFNQLHHSRFLLEYDTERAGTFEPLRFVPKGKTVVLGVVSTKVHEIESVEYLTRRVEEASRHIPLDQLAIGPQCGFASGIEHTRLTQDEQWLKFENMIEAARQIWG